MFLCSSVKAGHWETEKAEHRNAKLFALYGVSQKTCIGAVPQVYQYTGMVFLRVNTLLFSAQIVNYRRKTQL